MEENTLFCSEIMGSKLDNCRSSLILVSSDSEAEEFALTIDLNSESQHHKKDKKTDLRTWNKEAVNRSDDELAIGCEEDDTTVNFFIKVEKRAKKVRNSGKKSDKVHKEFKFEGEPFRKQNGIKKSRTTTDKEPQSRKCPQCDFEADSSKALYKHILNCNKTELFYCPDCPFSTTFKANFTRHTKLHCIRNVVYKCTVCTFGSDSLRTHKNHLNLHYDNQQLENTEIYQCPLCPFAKSYVQTVAHFKSHAKVHRDFENVTECPLCGMKTKKFGRHTRHHIKLKKDENTKRGTKLSGQETDENDMDGDESKVDTDSSKTDADGCIEKSETTGSIG